MNAFENIKKDKRKRRERRGMKVILCSSCHDCWNNGRITMSSIYGMFVWRDLRMMENIGEKSKEITFLAVV